MKIVIFFINLLDSINRKKIINFFKKEKININFFFDVGAHVGETTRLFYKHFKVSNIFCFEASPFNYKILEKRIKKSNNIKIFNYALGNKEGKNNFNQLIKESSSSTLVNLNKDSAYFINKKKILNLFLREDFEIISSSVQIRKLENFMNENSINLIDILKIDTEGYEFHVIKGAGKKIKNINYIYFEHHFDDMLKKGYTFSDIHNYLLENGFEKKFKLKMFFRKSFEYIYKNKYNFNEIKS
tara:strand:+ start:18 stop:743 length:726 start_codon:yes stop_codon:yes gene_type:complete